SSSGRGGGPRGPEVATGGPRGRRPRLPWASPTGASSPGPRRPPPRDAAPVPSDGVLQKFPFSAAISLARAGPIRLPGSNAIPAPTGARMNAPLADELATLGQLPVSRLRARYAELFGEETRVGNKLWLIRRIAWRLQALAEGDLSQRARQRA